VHAINRVLGRSPPPTASPFLFRGSAKRSDQSHRRSRRHPRESLTPFRAAALIEPKPGPFDRPEGRQRFSQTRRPLAPVFPAARRLAARSDRLKKPQGPARRPAESEDPTVCLYRAQVRPVTIAEFSLHRIRCKQRGRRRSISCVCRMTCSRFRGHRRLSSSLIPCAEPAALTFAHLDLWSGNKAQGQFPSHGPITPVSANESSVPPREPKFTR
jgi:hypothetical protein